MAKFKIYENSDYKIPHISVFNKFWDGELSGFRLIADDGYVLYNAQMDEKIINPQTMEEETLKYYFKNADIPARREERIHCFVAVKEEE